VAQRAARLSERLFDDLEDAPRLLFYRGLIGAHWTCAGNMHSVSGADGAREADHWFKG
jgi:hypothetical protein